MNKIVKKFIVGKKLAMSQLFGDDGKVTPVTFVSVGEVAVKRLRTKEKDGYEAVQVSFGKRGLREFKAASTYQVGDKIDVSMFEKGDKVRVSGVTKGHGFQGVVKRHGFHGAPKTHGTKHAHRQPGSISGGGRAGGRVSKGLRMAGHMGVDRVTFRGITVANVFPDKNVIALKGAVPGHRGSLVEIVA